MGYIKFRLAKPCDAKQIAHCHWKVRDRYSHGIFLSMGESFLRAYYKIILDDPWEVVVCAENDKGKIIGFSSATLDAALQAKNLRKHKIKLGIAALGAILKKPILIKDIWMRYKALNNTHDTPKFVKMEGVRGEYWCWLKDEDSLLSVNLDNAKGHIMYDLGYKDVYFEVDKINKQVYKYHTKVCKAEIIDEIVLPDGRVRTLLKKKLKPSI